MKRLVLAVLLLGLWATSADAFRPRGSGGVTGPSAGFLTTETFINTSASTSPTDWPLSRGMAFRRGDVAGTQHPEIRIASGSTCSGTLLDYQWDEISTYKENGQTGGYWRVATYTVRVPAIAAGSRLTLAFCSASGAYSATPSSITAAALCAAHPFSILFNNVQNQNSTTRDSGTMTWNLSSNCNTGLAAADREVPIEVANGPIRHSWIFRGSPVYATSSNKDPMAYVKFYVDAFSVNGSLSTIDRVRYDAQVSNPWMAVQSGSRGFATATSCSGGLCPQGFTNDPQGIYYTPVVKDGGTTLIDYDALFSTTIADPTIPNNTVNATSTTSPGIGAFTMFPTGAPLVGVYAGTKVTNTTNANSIPNPCYVQGVPSGTSVSLSCTTAAGTRGNGVQAGDNLRFETFFANTYYSVGTPTNRDNTSVYFQSNQSASTHLYYPGSAFWYTSSGTPPAGMTSGTMLFASPTLRATQTYAGDRFQLNTTPSVGISNQSPALVVPTTSGSGPQTLSFRIFSRKFTGWHTADINGLPRWTGSVGTDPFQFSLDQGSFGGERRYLATTGTIPPLNLANCAYWAATFPFNGTEYENATYQYYPMNITLAIAGSGGAEHGYIGIMSEWTARWWCSQDPVQEKSTTIFAMDGDSFPATMLLNEATGRLPTLNNGAPVGGHGGGGTPYTNLGSLYPTVAVPLQTGYYDTVVEPGATLPGGGNALYGAYGSGIFQDHQSAYTTSVNVVMWGDRHVRETMQTQAERLMVAQYHLLNGPSAETRPNRTFNFPAGSGTPAAGHTYYSSLYLGNTFSQGPRAGAWMARAIYMTAGTMADSDAFQPYFNDIAIENNNWWTDLALHKDCTTPGTAQPGIWSDSMAAAVNNQFNQGFMAAYNIMGQYFGWTMLRSPDVADRYGGTYVAVAQAIAGTSGWPTSTPAKYMGSFAYYGWGDVTQYHGGKCRGPYVPSVSQFWDASQNMMFDTSNGKFWTYRADPSNPPPYGDGGVTFTAGDKLRNWNISNGSLIATTEDLSTGGPGVAPQVVGGPDQITPNVEMCIVNFSNTTHQFQLAPPSPTCATPGATITSFSTSTDYGQCVSAAGGNPPVPPGLNQATSWYCNEAFGYRLQDANPVANPAYLFWTQTGMKAMHIAGFSAIDPYLAQASTVASYANVSGSNSAFDYDATIVVP